MSPIIRKNNAGQYEEASAQYYEAVAQASKKESKALLLAEKIFFIIAGGLIGLETGVLSSAPLELLAKNLGHESIMSNPLGLILTAIIYAGTTGIGAIGGNALRRTLWSRKAGKK